MILKSWEIKNFQTVYKAENKLLTWLLALLGLFLLAAIVTLVLCCICPSCPFYMEPRKRRIHSSETLVARSDGRPKRHLHRKPFKVMDGNFFFPFCIRRKHLNVDLWDNDNSFCKIRQSVTPWTARKPGAPTVNPGSSTVATPRLSAEPLFQETLYPRIPKTFSGLGPCVITTRNNVTPRSCPWTSTGFTWRTWNTDAITTRVRLTR